MTSPWLRLLLAGGAMLAMALLLQTVGNYRYVSNNLILQEGRRIAQERVRNVERAARLANPQDAAAFQVLLDDLRTETADQLAGIALVEANGTILAASGDVSLGSTGERRRGLADRDMQMRRESQAGRDVLVGVFPCRCSLRRDADRPDSQPGVGRLLVQVALYEDTLSVPFSRLRRNAIISASAALSLLVALALIAARAGAYIRGKQLETQVLLARQVQQDLLPSAASHPSGVDVAAACLPASDVGGDFYDIVELRGGSVSFVLGDVSGHGISAALLMGLIHGAMSNPPWGASEDPGLAAERLNQLLLTKSSGERFASLFWCAFDPESRSVRYLNAGHLPALWLRRESDGTWRADRLTEGGPVLGLLAGATYRTPAVSATEGDLLVLFSDGITEAPNAREEHFGEERLIAVVQERRDQPAQAICEAVFAAVKAFTQGRPAPDDRTLLVVRLWHGRRASPA